MTETMVTLIHQPEELTEDYVHMRRIERLALQMYNKNCSCTTVNGAWQMLFTHNLRNLKCTHPLKLLCSSMLREPSLSLSSYGMEHWRENYGFQHQQTMDGKGIHALKHGWCLTGHIWKMLVLPVHYFCTALATKLVRGGVNATKES